MVEQPQRIAVGDIGERANLGGGTIADIEDVLQRPQHQRQRRAQLVADIAEKGRLGTIELGQRLRLLAPLLVRVGVVDGGN
ncbi:MAG: hypothetical protein ACLGHO_04080, partial [Gammaproteobacteria bacterium]